MNGASMPPEDPEGVDRAYQRASAADPSRPGSGVRASILSQARRSSGAPRAANDDRWRWQAAAGIAAIGLVGTISWHFVRVAGSSSVAAVQQPAPPPSLPPAVPAAQALVLQGAKSASMDRMNGTLPSAPAAANAAPAWRDQALRSARMRYPELFGPAPARGAAATITIALNADGTVYRSTQAAGTAVVPAAHDAAARVSELLSLAPTQFLDSGVLAATDGVTVVYGVLAPSAVPHPATP
jgi:hypothetical protein